MKIIDLLNKIANDEEIPNKFEYDNLTFKRKNNYYVDEDGDSLQNSILADLTNLNDEVEIIEEDKKIEKINDILRVYDLIPPVDENMYKIWKQTIKNHNKINEIIDYLMENKQ